LNAILPRSRKAGVPQHAVGHPELSPKEETLVGSNALTEAHRDVRKEETPSMMKLFLAT